VEVVLLPLPLPLLLLLVWQDYRILVVRVVAAVANLLAVEVTAEVVSARHLKVPGSGCGFGSGPGLPAVLT
jgi:hypothetical protein